MIANRTAERAIELAREFSDFGEVSGAAFDGVEPLEPFDLIVNATSASLKGEVPPIPPRAVDKDTTCYDMAYGIGETPFTQWARDRGVTQGGAGLGHARRTGGRGVLRLAWRAPGNAARARSAARPRYDAGGCCAYSFLSST